MAVIAFPQAATPIRQTVSRDDWIMRGGLVLVMASLAISILLPLYFFFSKSVENAEREFIGLVNYVDYFASPGLVKSIYNSFFIAGISTAITIPLAFVYAYALTRSCLPGKTFFSAMALVPMLGPTLLPAISFVYFFGTQGIFKWMLFGHKVYGPIGIVMGEVFHIFPHAFIIILTAMSIADARLYEAAITLRASKIRTFFVVTLPSMKYGLISASFVAFSLAITDFGVPKVIGGQFSVLATDIYMNVIGMQDMETAAVVGVVLLVPAVFAFTVDRIVQGKQVAQISSGSVPYEPKPNRRFDLAMMVYCGLIVLIILGTFAMAGYASIIKFWPYNHTLTLVNYDFSASIGWEPYVNSLTLAGGSALFGTCLVFFGAYLVEKMRGFTLGCSGLQLLAMLPMAVPGMVLGLAFIFFFNHPNNPLNFLYGTMTIMVICTITHFYTVSHLTAVTALKQMDREFESVAASMKVPIYRVFQRVTVPICLPTILNISVYFFINGMTTVSAIVFLYSPHTATGSLQMLFLDDWGQLEGAAAMGMLIIFTSAAVRILYWLLTRGIDRRTQAWRHR